MIIAVSILLYFIIGIYVSGRFIAIWEPINS